MKVDNDNNKYAWKEKRELKVSFILKLYLILSLDLLTSMIVCYISIVNDQYYDFQRKNIWLLIIISLITLGIPIASVVFAEMFKNGNYKYFLLILYFLSFSYVISFICRSTNPKVVLMTSFMTFSTIFALFLFVFLTKTEFLVAEGIFFCTGVSSVLFFVFCLMSDYNVFYIILSSLWVVLYGSYIIYDSKLIIGKVENRFGINDYILASFSFCTDIPYIIGSKLYII